MRNEEFDRSQIVAHPGLRPPLPEEGTAATGVEICGICER
jgi:hypothetical protein